MTKPTTATFGEYSIQLGDGATPTEVFTAPCGLTTKGFTQTANLQKTAVPDCDDPDAPAYNETGVDTIDAEITGTGILAMEAFPTWQNAFFAAGPINCRVYPFGLTAGYYEGAFILSSFKQAVQRGQKVQADITLTADGQYTWVEGMPPMGIPPTGGLEAEAAMARAA
jgi:Phage tail tube protein